MSDSVPSVPVNVGEMIAGKYRVERLLGAGGMGVVVAATHVDLDRRVAVKLIRDELASESSTVERLMLEARAAAKIKSEHVGRVLDVGKLPSGAPYIVMEYLDGVDLCQLLEQQGALKITQAVDFVMQACEALAEAHVANIVHRDLKPENLFVTQQADGTPLIKVLDFGISKQLNDTSRRQLTNPQTAVGSPRYMAPEQMQAGGVDVRADIWSLGAILYECLSNEPAFDSDTLPGICAQVLGQEPQSIQTRVAHVPDSLAQIIERCLRKNRDERFNNVAELAAALAPFGTERAQASKRRITALIGGMASVRSTLEIAPATVDVQSKTAVVETGPDLGSTVRSTTAGRGMAVDVDEAVSAAHPTKRRAVWPFVALPALLAVLVAAVVLVTREPESAASLDAPDGIATEATAAAASADLTRPSLTPSAPADDPASVSAASKPTPEDAGTRATDGIPKQVEAQPERPRPVRVTPVRPRLPTRPAAPREPDKPARGTDAWDLDNFGGRE